MNPLYVNMKKSKIMSNTGLGQDGDVIEEVMDLHLPRH